MDWQFENKEICSKCGGQCCQHGAGGTYPEDFGSTDKEIISAVRAAIDSGKYCLDWWEGDPRFDKPNSEATEEELKTRLSRAYFVRPRHTNAADRARDPSWGGVCVFWSIRGCALPHEKRPAVCRALEPKIGFPKACESHTEYEGKSMFNKRVACLKWLPYNYLLESL